MTKKVKVIKFSVKEDTENLATESLTEQMNNGCPEGYHFKSIVLSNIERNTFSHKYEGSTWVIFEED